MIRTSSSRLKRCQKSHPMFSACDPVVCCIQAKPPCACDWQFNLRLVRSNALLMFGLPRDTGRE